MPISIGLENLVRAGTAYTHGLHGFTGLGDMFQAGIPCAHDSYVPQPADTEVPVPEDVLMDDVAPSDGHGDEWDKLETVVRDLYHKDPRSFAPTEADAIRALNLLRQVKEEEKQTSSIDVVMRSPSPSPSHQELPPEFPADAPESTPSGPLPSVQVNTDPKDNSIPSADDDTTSINVRPHPYPCHGGKVPEWKKKSASACTLSYRETRGRSVEEEGTAISESLNEQRFIHATYFITDSCQRRVEELTEIESQAQAKLQELTTLEKTINDLSAELNALIEERKRYPTDLQNELRAATASRIAAIQRCNDLVTTLHSQMQQPEKDFYTVWGSLQGQFDIPRDFWPPGLEPQDAACDQPRTSRSSSSVASSEEDDTDQTPDSTSEPSSSSCFSEEEEDNTDETLDSTSETSSSCFSEEEDDDTDETLDSTSEPSSPSCPSSSFSSSSSSSSSSSAPDSPTRSTSYMYKFMPTRPPHNDAERLTRYDEGWSLLRSDKLMDESVTFEQMPWPVLFDLKKDQLERLNDKSLGEFFTHLPRCTAAKDIKQEQKRWHSDKIELVLHKFQPADRDAIRCASKQISGCLNDLLEKDTYLP